MPAITFKTDEDVEVIINPASIIDANNLKNTILKLFKQNNFDITNISSVKSMIEAIMILDSSEEFQKSIFACLSRSVYKMQRIDLELFNDETARQYYYEILIKCLEVNISPFFKKALIRLLGSPQIESSNTQS
jgi:hypothetical protein